RFPPRVRARELWRIDPRYLEEAQDDATRLAIADQERAGLDIVTDGEMRRESYSNRFATALEGVDIDNPGTALDRSGHPNPVPRIVGPIARRQPVEVADLRFLRTHTDRTIKMTVPGPFTMSQQAQNDHYPDAESAAMGYAADQISIETAQSGLDLGVLADLSEKTIILGVLDLSTSEVESVETVAARGRRAFDHHSPEKLVLAPDCGMKYLTRDSAFGKM